MSHEQSETIQRDGKWYNVYGKNTPKAGQVLPDEPAYDTVESAVGAAKLRSEASEPSRYGDIVSDMAESRSANLRYNIRTTRTPDQHADLLRLSQQTGLPKSLVANQEDEVRKIAERDQFDYKQIAAKNPRLADWMLDEDNAALSRDNMDAMSAWERMFTSTVGAGRSLAAGAIEFAAGTYQTVGVPFALASDLNKKGGVFPSVPTLAAGLVGDKVSGTLGVISENVSDTAARVRGDQSQLGFVEQSVRSGFESLGHNIPGLFGGVLLKSAGTSLFTMVQSVFGNEYRKATDKGLSTQDAALYALGQAEIEYVTEAVPVLWFLDDLKAGAPFYKMLTRQLASEIPGEQAATILQDFQEWATLNPERPFAAYLNERPSAAAQTLIATIVAVGSQTGGTKAITAGMDVLARRQESQQVKAQAENQKNFFMALADSAKRDKLIKRMPEKAQEYIKSVTANGDKTTVYVDPVAWQTLFQEAGPESPAEAARDLAGMTQEQYQEAVALGRKIAVPMEKFAAIIAPTEAFNRIAEDITYDVNGMTFKESQEYGKELDARLEEAEAALESGEQDSSQSIFDDILEQRLAMGVDQSRATKEAKLTQAFFRTVAKREGLDPLELFKSKNLQITARAETAAGKTLNQPSYPIAPPGTRYTETGIEPTMMSPDEYLSRVRPLEIDDASRDAIDELKRHIESGGKLDPLHIYKDGKEDGRHRAIAAKEMGIAEVPVILFQPADDGAPRGSLSFTEANEQGQRFFKMFLGENADRSTFIHESGHLYLEVLGDLAQRKGATEQTKQDYETLLKWFGVKDRSQIKTEHHEKFARGFEAYVFEGKAPSQELQSVFARFGEWLVGIYRTIKNLRVTLNDDVRQVMDRMLASEEEIARARSEANQDESLITPELAKAAGLSDAEYSVLVKTTEKVREAQKQRLTQKLMDEIKRGKTEAYKDRAKAIRAEVEKEAKEKTVYRMILDLRSKETPVKLDHDTLADIYGEKYVSGLPKGIVSKNGIHPDVLASMYGIDSGDRLMQLINNAPPMDDFIASQTEQRLAAEFPSMMDDGSIGEEAAQIVRDDSSNEILLAELRALKKAVAMVRSVKSKEATADNADRSAVMSGIPTLAQVRETVRALIPKYRVMDLNPDLYRRAAQKASKEAFEFASKKKWAEAADAKFRQLYNNEMYRQVRQAQERAQKIAKHMKRYDKTDVLAKIGKAGHDYVDQILNLLEGYDFRKVSKKEIRRRKGLAEWVREQEDAGEPVNISPQIIAQARRTNWQEATFQELNDLYDAVRNIEHLADTKNKLIYLKKTRDFNEYKAGLIASIRGNSKGALPRTIETGLPEEANRKDMVNFMASLRKASSIVKEIDGLKDGGVMWEGVILPINESGDLEANRNHEALLAFRKVWSMYSPKERKAMQRKEYNADLGVSLNKRGLLAIAYNWGNDYQRDALVEGYARDGWTHEKVTRALSKLDAKDWEHVRAVADYLHTYWPEIEAQQKRVEGVAPEKVQPSPFMTPHGLQPGWYYPIIYDTGKDDRAFALKVAEQAKELTRGVRGRPATRLGAVNNRVGSAGMQIKLDPGVMFDHVRDTIHHLTHQENVRAVSKILSDKEIRQEIIDHYGIQKMRELDSWLMDVAAGDVVAMDGFERRIGQLRSGVSVAAMAFKFTTTAIQLTGLGPGASRIGSKWMARGIKRLVGDAADLENAMLAARQKSLMMANRGLTMDREIYDIKKEIDVKSKWRSWMDDYGFVPVIKMQQIVDSAVFWGAYERYMDETKGDDARSTAMAEQAVLDSQGSGSMKDLARIQRGSQFKKIWTVFYTFMNAQYQLQTEAIKRTNVKSPADLLRLSTDMVLLYTVPYILGDLMLGRGPDEDDDEGWLSWLFFKHVEAFTGTVPFVRDAAQGVFWATGYQGPAGARVLDETANLGKQLVQAGAGVLEGDFSEVLDPQMAKAANRVGGIVFHYPSAQLEISVEGLVGLADGEQDNPFVILNKAYGED